jgi:plasmid stabilization system protein ParE
MNERRARVGVAANFQRNLDQIRRFLAESQAPSASFDALLTQLFETVIPALERFPEIGTDLLARQPGSVEGVLLTARVRTLLPPGASLRQFISGDYLLLYLLDRDDLHLLAIRHHRQLSFDLSSFWP